MTPWICLLVVFYETKGFCYKMDNKDKGMHYLSLVLKPSNWACEGGRIQPQWGETGMPISSLTIHRSGECTCHMYDSSILPRYAKRLLDKELPRGYAIATTLRRHHYFYEKLSVGSKEPIHTSRPIQRFLRPLINGAKSAFVEPD